MSTQSTSVAIFIETHSLVRERQFTVRNIEHALSILKMERATGKLIVNLTSGTIGSLQFEERARLDARLTK